MEGIFFCQFFAAESLCQSFAEGFDDGEEDSAALGKHGVAFDVVKIAIRTHFVLVVEAVGTKELNDFLVFNRRLGNIGKIDAGGVREEFDIKAELVFLHLGGAEGIDVLHHEVPVPHAGHAGGVLQCLDEEHFRVVFAVGGKLSDLIGHALVGVLISNRQHLVGLQGLFERDEAECAVQHIL